MDINEKNQKVQAWLATKFAGKAVPPFERTEHSINLLYQLMLKNIRKDQETQLIIQDLRHKTTEYSADAKRVGSILGRLSVGPGLLSQSGMTNLRTLGNLAWLLRIRDISDSSYLTAMKAMQDKEEKLQDDLASEERQLALLTEKTRAAIHKHSTILKSYNDLDLISTHQAAEAEKKMEEISFLRDKIQYYKQTTAKLETQLKASGVKPNLYHEHLVKKAQDLQELEEDLAANKRKLQNFHELPADISRAKMKIAEMRHEVNTLEEMLSQKIDVLKM